MTLYELKNTQEKLNEIIIWLESGKKVTTTEWDKENYIYLVKPEYFKECSGLIIRDENNNPYSFTVRDLFELNWYIKKN